MEERHSQARTQSALIKRFVPLVVLLGGLAAFFGFGLEQYVSFNALRDNREVLLALVHRYGLLASLAYVVAYATVVMLSLPGGAVLSITGGFLFGTVWGTVHIVFSATLGATLLFLIAKTSVGDLLRATAGPWLQRMQAGFQENALSYLLVLRLVPLFPFFVVNLVPAFLGVALSTYILGTFVGIIPGALVYASVGAGLGSLFDTGGEFSAKDVLTPQILTALIGLALLALIPVVYKKFKRRTTGVPE
jgi:uncharacterized membrane protein YdjX (TVP38/TMEM64 family)